MIVKAGEEPGDEVTGEHILQQCMHDVFTSWLGPRRAPADATEQTEAGKLQGECYCCPH